MYDMRISICKGPGYLPFGLLIPFTFKSSEGTISIFDQIYFLLS